MKFWEKKTKEQNTGNKSLKVFTDSGGLLEGTLLLSQ